MVQGTLVLLLHELFLSGRRNIHTVIFTLNLIKSRVRVSLGLRLIIRVIGMVRFEVFLVTYITGFRIYVRPIDAMLLLRICIGVRANFFL